MLTNTVLANQIVIIPFFKSDQMPISVAICLEKDTKVSWTHFALTRAFTTLQLILLWLLYYSSMKFVRSQSTNNKLPKIIGIFQRNMVTFRQTVIFWTVGYVYNTVTKSCINCFSCFYERGKVQLLSDLFYVIVILSLQVILLLNLKDKFPLDSKRPVAEKPRSPDILPRRDILIPQFAPRPKSRILYLSNDINTVSKVLVPVTSFHKSKVIFVKRKNSGIGDNLFNPLFV